MEFRRKENRIRTRGPVRLVTAETAVHGHICDWSFSGACVLADGALPVGAVVEVEGEGFEAFGRVCNCQETDSRYMIGLALDQF